MPHSNHGADHIVLNVADIDRSLNFYTEVLGLPGERVDEFKAGKVRFPSVRINAATIIDLFRAKKGGTGR
jgi:catechol 2,3-dioxygenase-like lactoylglutathione lyase family enzyme